MDGFSSLNRTSSILFIKSELLKLNIRKRDLFKLWMYKRHKKYGDGEKLLSYKIFLVLYDLYPECCIKIVEHRVFSKIGYWKDIFLTWKLINSLEMDSLDKYNKYNKLIMAFRSSILIQRYKDLKKLSMVVSPKKLGDFSNEELRNNIINLDLDLSNIGKYCVRETSPLNKELYWYLMTLNGLKKEYHVSYIIRESLKLKIPDSDIIVDYPYDKKIPNNTKKIYRILNSKLNVVLINNESIIYNIKNNNHFPKTIDYSILDTILKD